MASKLGDGLWQAKFMLPEHAAALGDLAKEQRRKPRKYLADHELERINHYLALSKQYRFPISIKMYDPFETLRIEGVIEAISKLQGQFKVGDDWFIIDDIESVEIDDEPC